MRKNGSITVFLAMMIVCFFSAVFGFLEAARVSGLKANSLVTTEQVADTVMASYQRSLWSDYRLLFWEADDGDLPDLSGLEQLATEAVEANVPSYYSSLDNDYVLQIHLGELSVSAYRLATDDDGFSFREQATQRMKETVTSALIQTVLSRVTGTTVPIEDETDLADEAIDALEAMVSASSAESESNKISATGNTASAHLLNTVSITRVTLQTDLTVTESDTSVSLTENPLVWVQSVQNSGVLSIVLSGAASQKAIDTSDCIGSRTLEVGNMSADTSRSATDKVLFYLYLEEYFSDASETSDDSEDDGSAAASTERALDYELEYMIAGKSGDTENLKAVVRRLLLMRETANLAYLESNASMQQEATVIATTLATLMGQPELISVIRQGLLAAWAYAESLSDVRILLDGGCVSLVKTADQWHTQLGSLSTSVYSGDASEQTTGLSYGEYLQILLWATGETTVAQRALDMIEKSADVKMDQMLCCMECEFTYEASALFWNYVTLGQYTIGEYRFTTEKEVTFMGNS